MVTRTLYRCRGNSECRNSENRERHAPRGSADIAETSDGITWVWFGRVFNETGNVRIT
jgi:hypothetical protein